jgi:hypothetical protein
MVRSARILLLAVMVGTATSARAQAPAPGAAPDALPPMLPPARTLLAAPPAEPPTPTFAPAPLPGPYFERDPLLDRPPLPPPGWFADVDLGVVIPHVKNKLIGTVQVPGAANPDRVALPSADLDWTILPRFEAGYRLPSGFGACSLTYRFLDSRGTGITSGMDGPAALKSRLDMNEIGLDYTSDETSLWPHWDMRWRVGVRLIYVYFDSRADESPELAAADSGIVEQRESNWFVGFGPHWGVELARQLGGTGLALVTRVDFATYLGHIRQGFYELATSGGPNDGPLAAETRNSTAQAVPTVQGFFGLRWQPTQCPNADVFVGYQYEHWWSVGKLFDSSGELNVQGFFVRAEWNF